MMTRHAPGLRELKAYVLGDSSEPMVISAFRSVSFEDRASLVNLHRTELAAIDRPRLLILESLLLPWDARQG